MKVVKDIEIKETASIGEILNQMLEAGGFTGKKTCLGRRNFKRNA